MSRVETAISTLDETILFPEIKIAHKERKNGRLIVSRVVDRLRYTAYVF